MKKDFASDAVRSLLEKRVPNWARVLLFVLAAAVFGVFSYHARYAMLDEFGSFRYGELLMFTAVVFTALYAVILAVELHFAKNLDLSAQILLCVIAGAVLLGKISLLDYVSDDYSIFLSDWIYSYTAMDIKQGLGTYIGSDYTPPYLYLMLLISRVEGYPWQYLIKAISMLWEVLMAYAVMKLAGLRVKGEGARLFIFNIALLLPTVVFNGAYWGQCDVIYTSFCLLAVYLALKKRGVWSMTFFGVALSFKLQTVFFLPILLPLWLRKDIKLRHLLMIPAAYMAMMIPALWGGKSLHHVLTCYLMQMGTYNAMSVNGPSLYNILPKLDASMLFNMFSQVALVLGFAMLLIACAIVCRYHDRLTVDSTILFGLLVLGGVPFFMPKMHERYTFGADVLAVAAMAYKPRRVILPLLFGLASYVCYTEGLPGQVIMDLKWATFFQGAAVVLTARELWRSLNDKQDDVIGEVKA